jgi:putative addiction module killer protein
MNEVRETATFTAWSAGIRDRNAVARIDIRIRRLTLGNPGNVQPVGDGVSEMKSDYGPKYRAYYKRRGPIEVLLLCGGDKK